MKILHEINQLDKGGAERVVEGIIKHDRANHHTIYTYKDGPMRPILEAAGAVVVVENPEKSENIDCDIVHIHTGGQESRIANAVRGHYPTIETIHSPIVTAVRDEFVMCRVGVSNFVTRFNRKCRTIYNGINLDRLKLRPETNDSFRKIHGIPDEAFVVGRLGRIGSDKCLEAFLVACKKVQDSGLVPNMHVLIVGDDAANNPGHLAKMKVAAASLPVKNVHWVPALEEVGYAYEAMDLFLYPSPTEGFGLVFFEAMASGVPVITWKNELTTELLYGAAWLSKEETPASLADDVIYFALNEGVRKQFAAEGVKHAQGFTEERMSSEYQKLYAETFKLAYGSDGSAPSLVPAQEGASNV